MQIYKNGSVNMRTSLVIMAAGLASRYGGNKQIDGIGPNGEILMEYSICDALRAGFNKVIFIIKPEMQGMMDQLVGYLRHKTAANGQTVEVAYAYQDFTSIPASYPIPEDRVKPFGTVHALLCARDLIHEPFCVINADDYYGINIYQSMHQELQRLPNDGHKAIMAGYLLKNTASLHGSVSRGVCKVRSGNLISIKETKRIQLYPDGTLRDLDANVELSPESIVNMNLLGFMPSFLDRLDSYFEDFLKSLSEDDIKSECILPVMLGEEAEAGRIEVSVLHSTDKWFGMTYREDRGVVQKELQYLHGSGAYPETLRG